MERDFDRDFVPIPWSTLDDFIQDERFARPIMHPRFPPEWTYKKNEAINPPPAGQYGGTRAETNRALAAGAPMEEQIMAAADIKEGGVEIIIIIIIIMAAAMEHKTDNAMAMAMSVAIVMDLQIEMTIGRDSATAADMEQAMAIIIMMGTAKAGATITDQAMAMAMVARRGERARIKTPIGWSVP